MKVDLRAKNNNDYYSFFNEPKSMQYSPVENRYLKDYNLFFIDSHYKNNNQNSNNNLFTTQKNETMYYNFFQKNKIIQNYNHYATKIRPLINYSKNELILDSFKKDNKMNLVNRIRSTNSIKELKKQIRTGNPKIKLLKKKTYTMSLVDKLSENFNKYIKLNPINRNRNHLNLFTKIKFNVNRKALSHKEPKFQIENSIGMSRFQLEAIGQKKNLCLNKLILQLDNTQNNFVKKIKMNQRSFLINFNKKGRIIHPSMPKNYGTEGLNFRQNMSVLNSTGQFSIVFKRLKYKKDLKL